MKPAAEEPRRAYQQSKRADATEATGERIVDAALRLVSERWMDEFTLAEIAKSAEVTVQTVIRRFGSKEGVLAAITDRLASEMQRTAPEARIDSLDDAIRRLMDDYERTGDMTWRILAQEERHPYLLPLINIGRAHFRAWIERSFAGAIAARPPARRQALVDGLVAAMDVFVWKLLRRDMGRSREQTAAILTTQVQALLGPATAPRSKPEKP